MRKRDRHQLIKKMITEEKIKYTKKKFKIGWKRTMSL